MVPSLLGTHYAIQDDVNNYTSPSNQPLGDYDIEQPGSFLNVGGPGGPTIGGGLSVLLKNKNGSTLAPGTAVCVSTTSGNANSVIACPAVGGAPFAGVMAVSTSNNSTGAVTVAGIASGLTWQGTTCSIGQYATYSGAGGTAGDISCTGAPTVTAALGVVMNVVGSSVTVLVAPR